MKGLMGLIMLVALIASVLDAGAQSDDDATTFSALALTPTGGVAPATKQWMLTEPRIGIGADVQSGHVSGGGGSLDMFTTGVTLPFASGRGDVGFSAGYFMLSCHHGSCGINFIAGSEVEGRVVRSELQDATFTMGMSGRVGYAKLGKFSIWSGSLGVPLSLEFGSFKGLQVVSFATPALGMGGASVDGFSFSGAHLMLGAGIGVTSASTGFALNLGMQYVFIGGTKPVVGASVSWSGR